MNHDGYGRSARCRNSALPLIPFLAEIPRNRMDPGDFSGEGIRNAARASGAPARSFFLPGGFFKSTSFFRMPDGRQPFSGIDSAPERP